MYFAPKHKIWGLKNKGEPYMKYSVSNNLELKTLYQHTHTIHDVKIHILKTPYEVKEKN